MAKPLRVAVVSDIHYACAAEQARGVDYEIQAVRSAWRRHALRLFRDLVWLRGPTTHNPLFDRFLTEARDADFAVANGDLCSDTNFIGVSDDASCQSVREVLGKMRASFGDRFHLTLGDHELGKLSFVGARGGLRFASWQRATGELGLQPFWRVDFGRYVLIGVASTIVALPVYTNDALPEEMTEWKHARAAHLAGINAAFDTLEPDRRVILFAHDPTALPFLWRESSVQRRLAQIEQTFVGHLHSRLVFWKARRLAGVPVIRCFGPSPERWTRALREARLWKPFKPRLCPSLTGIELLKDGGYYTMELDPDAKIPARFQFHPLRR